MLRIGIAGLGGLGQLHLKNYLARPDVTVAALASRTGQLRAVQSNLGNHFPDFDASRIPVHTGYEPLCADPDVDVVSVNLPTDLHAAATVRALEAGKHVFCEKPIALRVADADRMLAAARAANRKLMIGHCLRFFPEYVAAEKIIRAGEIGKPLAAVFTRCGGIPTWGSENWFQNPARSGGAAIDLHIHDIDIALWWWGRPARIAARGLRPNLIHSQWHYPNGPAVQLECGWDPTPASPFYFNFKVVGETGTLLCNTRDGQGLQLAGKAGVTKVPLDAASGYAAEDNYFLDAILRDGALDRCPPETAKTALECAVETAAQLPA